MLTRVGASENKRNEGGKSRASRLFSACASDQRGGLVYAVYSLSVYCMCKTDQMKHLLTAIVCCLAVAGSAQTPYNPDSNSDGFVGSADLVSLLSLYGELAPVDSLTVVTVDSLELSGYQIDWGDSIPIYQVTADVDVVLAPVDTCMAYFLTADSDVKQKFWYESYYVNFAPSVNCFVLSDSLVYTFTGCNDGYLDATHLRGMIFLNGRWFCME